MINSKTRFVFIATVFLLCLSFCTFLSPVSAQDTTKVKKWNFTIDVYLMFPNMNGETGIGNMVLVPVAANPGDIFSKLKMAGMFYFEAKTEKWAITNDIVYMNLNQEITPSKLWDMGDVTVKQFIWETAGLYRIIPFLEVGVGGRLNNLSAEIDARRNVLPAGTEVVEESGTKTWFDPILITRIATDINEKWLFQFRGDVGGFGVGSDFTWQLQAYAGYRISQLFQITAGYRIISIDYDKGENSDRFVFDMNEFGPVVRFGFNF